MDTSADITLNHKDLHEFYETYFHYYHTLEPAEKGLFLERCKIFISNKEIAGAQGFLPDNRVKAFVAASAVQLTLGLEHWSLDYFDIIIIHPGDFDKSNGQRFRGETNLAGYMRLSWKSLLQGYKIRHDNINLGLHEFSHALRLNGFKGHRQDYFMEHYFDAWMAAAREAFQDLRQGKESIFRKYGGVNMMEFISVCIEHYFESPSEILERYPSLYYATGILLNQANKEGKTKIHVREEFFKRKNETMPGLGSFKLVTHRFSANALATLIVFLVYFYTMAVTGFFSGPSVLLATLCLLIYARYDFRYTRIEFAGKEIRVSKGLFIFKGRKRRKLLGSHLISVRSQGSICGSNEWELVYYDPVSDYFYQEELVGEKQKDELSQTLKRNQTAFFFHNK